MAEAQAVPKMAWVSHMALGYLQRVPRALLAGALIAVIGAVDWRVQVNIAFGFLYLLPMLIVGTVLPLWGVMLTALICTVLADAFDPFAFTLAVGLPQDILVFTSLAGAGLYSHEVARNREREKKHLMAVEIEAAARRTAEEQLQFLVETSPAAILTMGADHRILRANAAAHRLLGAPAGGLAGKSIRTYLPALGRIELGGDRWQNFRTEMQCRGEKEQGDFFLANVLFSTYETALGPRLAAVVLNASDALVEREELNLEQLLAASRILVGAVSHEVRNVCGAVAVIYENLIRQGNPKGNKDLEALGAMVETLNKIASLELKQSSREPQLCGIDLVETLGDLRLVLDPYCQQAEIAIHWDIPRELPPVWADRQKLLQVLLNLAKNSKRALEHAEVKRIDISARSEDGHVCILVTDTGPGISSAEKLFQPFQQGADATGLGLYLSRAFMRSVHGDLRHDPAVPGCCFVIEMAVSGSAHAPQASLEQNGAHETFVG
jgi:two-component system, LuxR family, sensor kinase FixL